MKKFILFIVTILFSVFSTNIIFENRDVDILYFKVSEYLNNKVSMEVVRESLNKSISTNNQNTNNTSLLVSSNTLTMPNVPYKILDAPSDPSVRKANVKSYMRFQALGKGQWNVQGHLARQKECTVGKYDIRMIDGRYFMALGSFYSNKIGTYFDVILEDGTVIPGILGDQKADQHTNSTHQYHSVDKSVIEIIVNSPWDGSSSNKYKYFNDRNSEISRAGNFSAAKEFKSPVKQIVVYEKVYKIDMKDLSGDIPDK